MKSTEPLSRLQQAGLALAVTLIVLASRGGEARAQESGDAQWGLKAGVNAASFLNQDFEGDRRIGITAGGFWDFELEGRVGIRTEALYTMKGVSVGDATVALDYLEVPVLARLALRTEGVGPVVYTGASAGLKVSAKNKSPSGETSYGDLVRRFEASWLVGASIESPAWPRAVQIDLRFTFGLTPVFDFDDPSDSDSDDKNQGISLTVGVKP